jgi:hypothetical protein
MDGYKRAFPRQCLDRGAEGQCGCYGTTIGPGDCTPYRDRDMQRKLPQNGHRLVRGKMQCTLHPGQATPGQTAAWRKSSHSSGPANTCVEVGSAARTSAAARVLVRDTARRGDATLAFPRRAWREFTTALK